MHFGNLILAQVCCRYIRMTFLPFKAQHPLLSCLNQHVPANPSGQGEVSPISRSIPTTDLTHHHVAVGTFGFLGTHRGSTLLIGAVSTPFGCLGDTLHESLRQQVGIACFGLASLVLIVGQHMLSMPSSGFVHFSVSTGNALCSHHQSIASALSVGSFVHLALFSLREGSKHNLLMPQAQ